MAAVKLPCGPLISIITAEANCAVKVRPIFLMVVIFWTNFAVTYLENVKFAIKILF